MVEGVENVYQALAYVQARIAVPKNKVNEFGGFKFRSLEDIHAVAKKACMEVGAVYHTFDEIEVIGDRYYLKATAIFTFNGEVVTTQALAREQIAKKGMDDAQVTGLASSYARKYALCALFNIDGDSDPDMMDNSDEGPNSLATEQQLTELGGYIETYALMCGKSHEEVENALAKSKTMAELGADMKCLTKVQAEKAAKVVKHWINAKNSKENS